MKDSTPETMAGGPVGGSRTLTVGAKLRFRPRSRALHVFAVFTAAMTFFLIVAGGLVTSTGSALAVPDWPLSFGMLMPPMVGGIFYEHGHRMIAGFVATLTLVLAVWLWLREPRRWVRVLGLVAFGAVIGQAVLGGLTVLLLLPPSIAIAHACLAQTFFCLTIALAIVTSPLWGSDATEARERISHGGPAGSSVSDEAGSRLEERLAARRASDSLTPWLAAALFAAVYVQLLIGAWMRHTDAGLAIPDFPWIFGGLVPDHWSTQIAAHYAHRVWAAVVLVLGAALVASIFRTRVGEARVLRPAVLLAALLPLQAALGGLTVLSGKQVALTTTHVATGAAILGTCLVLGLRLWHVRPASVPAAQRRSPAPASYEGAAGSAGAPAAASAVVAAGIPQTRP